VNYALDVSTGLGLVTHIMIEPGPVSCPADSNRTLRNHFSLSVAIPFPQRKGYL
jgi:hypothetical protein